MKLDEYVEIATKNTKQRLSFMLKLVKSKVITIGYIEKKLNPNGYEIEEIKLMNVLNSKKQPAVPFFTSDKKLIEFAEKFTKRKAPTLEIVCMDFFKLVDEHNSNVVLNPNCTYSIEFSASEVNDIVTGKKFK